MDLKGKVAVVTGAGSGIGRATSLKFASKGAKMVLVDFNEETGNETLNLIKEQGGEGIFVQANVALAKEVENYVNRAIETYGKIDIFFNNAGIIQKFAKLVDITEEEYDRVMSINVKGVYLGLKYVLQVMEKQKSGVIVNTASTAGIRSEHSLSVYSASKHAVVGLTKGAALEFAPLGIRVNAVAPGGVETALTAGANKQFEDGFVLEEVPKMRLGRYSKPEEIAEMVVFLASDKASYMTGSIVTVDGGLTL